jgi:hypothetical protein
VVSIATVDTIGQATKAWQDYFGSPSGIKQWQQLAPSTGIDVNKDGWMQLNTDRRQLFRPDVFTPSILDKLASAYKPSMDVPDIMALQAKITQTRFFVQEPLFKTRIYNTQFDVSTARYVYIELDIKYPAPRQAVEVPVSCVYFNSDGITWLGTFSHTIQAQPMSTESSFTYGWGWDTPGNWPLGTHRVECSAEGRVIARGSFEINQQPLELPENWNSKPFYPYGSSLDKHTIPNSGLSFGESEQEAQREVENAHPQIDWNKVLIDWSKMNVRRAQERLTALGFAPGPIDGVLGSQTRAALRQFQRAHSLPSTGELDDATLHTLTWP